MSPVNPVSPVAQAGTGRTGDRIFLNGLRAAAVLSLLVLALLVGMLLKAAWPVLGGPGGVSFFWRTLWDPVSGEFGAGAFVYGTLVSSVLALGIATPLSIGAALFVEEITTGGRAAGLMRQAVAFLIEMLAAIPSVVYGLWGIFVLAPLMREKLQPALALALGGIPGLSALVAGPPLGVGMLTASLVLAIMISPTLTSLAREIFAATPGIQREAALALGATRWEMIRLSVLGPARSALGGAVLLGWGRALGETMAVTMVIGNRPQVSASLFAPAQTLASVLANEYAEASDPLHLSALAALGCALLVIAVLVYGLSRRLVRRGSA